MRLETTLGMEAQGKQESARVSVYEICSPAKPWCVSKHRAKGNVCTHVRPRLYIRVCVCALLPFALIFRSSIFAVCDAA